jgi:hypothetical protein
LAVLGRGRPDAQKDSEFGSKGFDEVNQAKRPGNFGWPMFIGDNRPFRNYNFTTKQLFDFFDPKRPEKHSPNNTGARILPPPQPAMIWYPYERTERFPLLGEGSRTAMAGPVYYYGDYERSAERLPRITTEVLPLRLDARLVMAVTFDAAGTTSAWSRSCRNSSSIIRWTWSSVAPTGALRARVRHLLEREERERAPQPHLVSPGQPAAGGSARRLAHRRRRSAHRGALGRLELRP